MSKLAINFGVLLVLLGAALGIYTYTALPPERHSPTAFIPAIFGLLLLVCGLVARNDQFRMHAMHFAALVGLVGCVMPLFMAIKKLASGEEYHRAALGGQILMGVICGIFVALCVRSFIAARRARKSSGSA
ncbi:MAG TPA: hypothetical protein VHR72_12165 [Gemmataceae bacterium]|jgi:uncharacterized membrane protein|nr:hypothetical protein [Gemmataceae bacterium]